MGLGKDETLQDVLPDRFGDTEATWCGVRQKFLTNWDKVHFFPGDGKPEARVNWRKAISAQNPGSRRKL